MFQRTLVPEEPTEESLASVDLAFGLAQSLNSTS
jgi:hypothetical protein